MLNNHLSLGYTVENAGSICLWQQLCWCLGQCFILPLYLSKGSYFFVLFRSKLNCINTVASDFLKYT